MTEENPFVRVAYRGRRIGSGGKIYHSFLQNIHAEIYGDEICFSKSMGAKLIGGIYMMEKYDEKTWGTGAEYQNKRLDWNIHPVKEWVAKDFVAGGKRQAQALENKLKKEIEIEFWDEMTVNELALIARKMNKTQRNILVAKVAQALNGAWL